MTERSLELGGAELEQRSPETNMAATALVATVSLASAGLLVAGGGGSPLLAFAPLVLLAGAYALWRLPLRYTLLLLLAITLTADIPGERPGNPPWRSPLGPIGAVLYDNLNKATGIEALRFAGIEALFVVVLLLVLARVVLAQRVDSEGRLPAASALTWSLGLAFGMVMLLEVWGIVRGGDFRQSLWQFRQMLWLPILTALFSYSLRGPRDFASIGRVVAAAGCVKVAIGLYFLLAIARPQGVDPAHVTSHHDSTLFVTVIAMCVAAWVHRPTRRQLVLGTLISGWILIGLVINNRRIAFVSLFASLALLYTLLRGPMKRAATRAILLSIPVLLLYVAAGRFKTTGIFAPAAKILSVVQQKDASSATRDIENYNLLFTLKQSMLLGNGWGHEYIELTQAYDISHAFAQYRFIAHNSVLWLWTIGGFVGFTALWLPMSVGIFLSARSYRFARTSHERTAAASALAVMMAYIIQAWGDMGTQGWIGTFLMAAGLAVSGKLATATGAWPSHLRVASWARRPTLAAARAPAPAAAPTVAGT